MENLNEIVLGLHTKNKKLKSKLNEAKKISGEISELLIDLQIILNTSSEPEDQPVKPEVVISRGTVDHIKSIESLIRQLCETNSGLAPVLDIVKGAAEAGIDEDRALKILERMKKGTVIMEPRPGQYRLV